MARKGVGYFNSKGHFFKHAPDATVSDLAAILGKIGDGEGDSLAPGIALMLLEKREAIELIFAEHDAMIADDDDEQNAPVADHANVSVLADRKSKDVEQAS